MKPKNPYLYWIPRAIAAILILVCVFLYVKRNITAPANNSQNVNLSADAKKTIVISFGGIDYGDNIKTQISIFMKNNPDIEVKLLQLPNSTDYQRNTYTSAFKAGDSSIDVIATDIIWTAEFASNGWVMPLDRYFTEEMQKEFIKSAIDGCRYEGRLYAVPKRSDAPLLYYRSDIIPKAPETYDEMIDMVRRYQGQSGTKYGYVFTGNAYEGLVCCTLEFIWAYGGDVIKNGQVVINSPQAKAGLQKLVDIVNEGISSPDCLSFIEDDARLAFQDGSAIFMRNWPFAYKQVNAEYSKVQGKVKVCELPRGADDAPRTTGTLGGWNYMINGKSKYADEAWRLIEWLTSYDMQVLDNKTGGSPPTRIKVYSDRQLTQKDPILGSMQRVIELAHLRPVSPYYPSVTETMQINFSNALYKNIDVKTAIENIESDLNNLMANERP